MILPFTKPPVLFYQGNEALDKSSEKGNLKMGIDTRSIQELVSKIKRSEIRLPEMQRGYVWKAAKVRNLFDSLYRGYPSGTILVWETNEPLPARDFAITQDTATNQTFQLLLDGQQRMTSLYAVIHGEPIIVSDSKNPIDIMFNLEHPDTLTIITEDDEEENDAIDATKEEEKQKKQKRLERMTFEVKNKKLEKIPHWVSVTEVFKSKDNLQFLIDKGVVDDLNHPNAMKYNARLTALLKIKDYPYGVQVLDHKKNYEEVTDIFVRVNSLGTQLKSSDLAQAQITAKWPRSLKIFEEYQGTCKNAGFDLELGIFIKNLISFATGQCKFKTVSSLSKEKLKTAWAESNKGFDYAMNFLKKNVGIDSPALLTSPAILISMAYFFHNHGVKLLPKDENKLRYWALMANAHGRYSRGSSETMLDQDLREISKGKGLDGMIDLLRTQFGRLEIQSENLKNKNSASSYFKTMFLAFSKDEAKDWITGLRISLNHSGAQHKLQFHHIFPQSLFENPVEDKQKINDICNLAFIGGATNRRISNKYPSDYLPTVISDQGADILTAQQIPIKADLWEMDKYDEFLAKRREMVVVRLNKFLDHESIK